MTADCVIHPLCLITFFNYKDDHMRKTETWQDNREAIAELKLKDSHFATIFDEHTQLDQQINQLEKDVVLHASREEEIEQMKRRKLYLKDVIYKALENNNLKTSA